jgi:hypothetical protein
MNPHRAALWLRFDGRIYIDIRFKVMRFKEEYFWPRLPCSTTVPPTTTTVIVAASVCRHAFDVAQLLARFLSD